MAMTRIALIAALVLITSTGAMAQYPNTYYQPPSTYTTYGNQTFDNRGNSWTTYGNQTYDNRGGVCTTYGNMTYCN